VVEQYGVSATLQLLLVFYAGRQYVRGGLDENIPEEKKQQQEW
jgi:hypothetical protein